MGEVERKIQDIPGLATITVLSKKIGKVEKKRLDHEKYISSLRFNIFDGSILHIKLIQSYLAANNDVK